MKCDLCKKEIDHREKVGVNFANYNYENVDLCENCALPIFKFLKKSKLFNEPKKEIKNNQNHGK